MHQRNTIVGVLAAAMLATALPAATFAQDELEEEFGATPEGVVWSLTSAGGTAVPAEVEANLYMEDGQANGNTGCNSFSGTYTLDGESLVFDEEMAVTMAFCEGAAGEVEQAYMAALPTVASWAIDGTSLSLADDAGGVVLTFEEPIVELTETDIVILVTELERLHSRINNTRQEVRQLNVDKLRERVAGNEAVLGEVAAQVKRENVPGLRDRVVANEAVLEELTERFVNVRARVRDLEKRVEEIEKQLGLEIDPQ